MRDRRLFFAEKTVTKSCTLPLTRLEYRGYDSAGIALLSAEGRFSVRKKKGGVASIAGEPLPGETGIGHTRWATHGAPSDGNAHPHLCGKFALVHNGIVENEAALRAELLAAGEQFLSETDSELIVRLIARAYRGDFFAAVASACARVEGSYAVAVLCADFPRGDRLRPPRQSAGLRERAAAPCTCAAMSPPCAARQSISARRRTENLSSSAGVRSDFAGRTAHRSPRSLPACARPPARAPCRRVRACRQRSPRSRARWAIPSLRCGMPIFLAAGPPFVRRSGCLRSAAAQHTTAALCLRRRSRGVGGIPLLPPRIRGGRPVRGGRRSAHRRQSERGKRRIRSPPRAPPAPSGAPLCSRSPMSGNPPLASLAHCTAVMCAGPEIAVAATKSYNCQLLSLYFLAARILACRMGVPPAWAGGARRPAGCGGAGVRVLSRRRFARRGARRWRAACTFWGGAPMWLPRARALSRSRRSPIL